MPTLLLKSIRWASAFVGLVFSFSIFARSLRFAKFARNEVARRVKRAELLEEPAREGAGPSVIIWV